MTRKKIDWTNHGDEIKRLYASGMSTREVIQFIKDRDGIEYNSGTLTNFLGRSGLLRSKKEAHKLAVSKARRICEACGGEHTPANYNQRWCDECSGKKRYSRRLTAHGLPAIVIETKFHEQKKKCGICQRPFDHLINTPKKKTLFIDHDHETNQFRGLLCVRCNTALCFVDDKAWLNAAQDYLRKAASEANPVFVRQERKHRYVKNSPK